MKELIKTLKQGQEIILVGREFITHGTIQDLGENFLILETRMFNKYIIVNQENFESLDYGNQILISKLIYDDMM